MVFQRDGLLHHRVVVEQRVLAAGHRDFAKLLYRRAIERHAGGAGGRYSCAIAMLRIAYSNSATKWNCGIWWMRAPALLAEALALRPMVIST